MTVEVIVEVGVNHNGDDALARKIVFAAAEAGATAAKFQMFSADTLAVRQTPLVPYQARSSSTSHYQMLKNLELTWSQWQSIRKACQDSDIEFMATPYSLTDLAKVLELGVTRIKTASADITDIELQIACVESSLPCIVSTGMATEEEIAAIDSLYPQGQLTLMHAISAYPTADRDANMRRIHSLRRLFDRPIGYSDHTLGHAASIMAVALDASCIEKHVTASTRMTGPDHASSLEVSELKEFVSGIQRAAAMLGDGSLGCSQDELPMRNISRKSLHFVRDLPAGTVLGLHDVRAVRPNDGLPPRAKQALAGMRLTQDVSTDQPVSTDLFEI